MPEAFNTSEHAHGLMALLCEVYVVLLRIKRVPLLGNEASTSGAFGKRAGLGGLLRVLHDERT